jgi:predicted amidohydrolase
MPLAAVCQMNSGPDHGKNIAQACELVTHAAALGASFVALPENFELMASSAEKLSHAEALDGPTMKTLRDLARALGITLLCGSFAEKSEDPACTARSTSSTSS